MANGANNPSNGKAITKRRGPFYIVFGCVVSSEMVGKRLKMGCPSQISVHVAKVKSRLKKAGITGITAFRNQEIGEL